MSEHFSAIHPPLTRIKSHYSHHVDKKLKTTSNVWLQNDLLKIYMLQPRYSGPCEVVQRDDKVFTLNIKDSLKNVSIDRLQVVYLPTVMQRIPTCPAISAVRSDSETTTEAPNSEF